MVRFYDLEDAMANKTSASQARATAKYHKEHTKFVGLRFNTTHDWDILARLDAEQNTTGLIKRLIRQDNDLIGFDPGPKPGTAEYLAATLPPVEPVPTRELPNPETGLLPSEMEARRLLGLPE